MGRHGHGRAWARWLGFACALTSAPWVAQEELTYNPFLRCSDPALARFCGLPATDPVAVLAELRRRKDNFGLVPSMVTGVLSAVSYFKPALRYLGIDR